MDSEPEEKRPSWWDGRNQTGKGSYKRNQAERQKLRRQRKYERDRDLAEPEPKRLCVEIPRTDKVDSEEVVDVDCEEGFGFQSSPVREQEPRSESVLTKTSTVIVSHDGEEEQWLQTLLEKKKPPKKTKESPDSPTVVYLDVEGYQSKPYTPCEFAVLKFNTQTNQIEKSYSALFPPKWPQQLDTWAAKNYHGLTKNFLDGLSPNWEEMALEFLDILGEEKVVFCKGEDTFHLEREAINYIFSKSQKTQQLQDLNLQFKAFDSSSLNLDQYLFFREDSEFQCPHHHFLNKHRIRGKQTIFHCALGDVVAMSKMISDKNMEFEMDDSLVYTHQATEVTEKNPIRINENTTLVFKRAKKPRKTKKK